MIQIMIDALPSTCIDPKNAKQRNITCNYLSICKFVCVSSVQRNLEHHYFFLSDEVPVNGSFQVLHSRYKTLPCLHYFVCCFPLEGFNWKKALTLSHNNVGWAPSYFSSDAKSAQWLFGLKLGLNCVRGGRNVF